MARAGLALLAISRGDEASALEQYSALESQRGTMVQAGVVSVDRLLGLLANTMGNVDLASDHFEQGLAFCHKAGYLSEQAWTCYDYAEGLLYRNN